MPQQRLFFLNSAVVEKRADALAEIVKSDPTPDGRVRKAFEIVYQRPPTAAELRASLAFIEKPALDTVPVKLADDKDKEAPKALADSPLRSFCWALISSNEFLFVD